MLSRKCKVCGKEIVLLKNSNKKYCSAKCRKKSWKLKNRDKINEWQRKWFEEKVTKRLSGMSSKNCLFCNKEFHPLEDRQHPYKKFCSKQCQQKFNSRKQTKRRNEILKNPSLDPIAYKKHFLRKQVQNANYKALKRGYKKSDENHFTLKEWVEILEQYDYKCAECGTKENITIDHIKPISKKGKNNKNNIQPLCQSCNSKKQAKYE